MIMENPTIIGMLSDISKRFTATTHQYAGTYLQKN